MTLKNRAMDGEEMVTLAELEAFPSARVPKKFTTLKVPPGGESSRISIFFPLIDRNQTNHDAKNLLEGLDSAYPDRPAMTLQFNATLCAEKTKFFKELHARLLDEPGFKGSRAEKFINSHIKLSSEVEVIREVREQAQYHNIVIAQAESKEFPSIAVDKNPLFGSQHSKGMMLDTMMWSVVNLMFNAFMGPPTFSPFVGVILPATAICVAYNTHKCPPDPETFFNLKSRNYFSLPTIAFHGATATAFYATSDAVASRLVALTTTALGATTISLLTPVWLGALAYTAYQFGPSHSVITEKLNRVANAAQSLWQKTSCISKGVANLCERFGWRSRRQQQVFQQVPQSEMKEGEQVSAAEFADIENQIMNGGYRLL